MGLTLGLELSDGALEGRDEMEGCGVLVGPADGSREGILDGVADGARDIVGA